jgi:hypothetical protein
LFSVEAVAEVKMAEANPFFAYTFIEPIPETIPPKITILSPQNNSAYYSDNIHH